MAPKKFNAEALLRTPVGIKGKSPSEVWLDKHPEAKAFVLKWVELRRSGDTEWGLRSVQKILHERWGYPFRDKSTLSKFLED